MSAPDRATMNQFFDAIVIGAGQAGPSLAARLTATGMKVALVERKQFGGTCVNTGCMPTKTLVASSYAAHLARRSAEYGVAIESPINIDMKRVKARADTVSTNARTSVETWLRGMDGLTVIEGHARFERPDAIRVGESLLKAPRIFINVGGRASVPDMPGVGTVDYLTNTSILKLETVPRHLVVVGGSYIGLEFAQMYRRFGAGVTIVEKGPRLIAREDEDVSEAVKEILTDEGSWCAPAQPALASSPMRTAWRWTSIARPGSRSRSDLGPARSAQAPAISRLQPRKAELRPWGDEIIPPGSREGEELRRDLGTNDVPPQILRSGCTTAVAEKPRRRVHRARSQGLAKNVLVRSFSGHHCAGTTSSANQKSFWTLEKTRVLPQ
jgi:thioredoxin reductase